MDPFGRIWNLLEPRLGFGPAGSYFCAIWTLVELLLSLGLGGDCFGVCWIVLESLLGQRLAGTSLVAFGASWNYFWDAGRQRPFWCCFDDFGPTAGLERGWRKHFSKDLGCDGDSYCVHLVA